MKSTLTAADITQALEIFEKWKTTARITGKIKEIAKVNFIEKVIKELTGI